VLFRSLEEQKSIQEQGRKLLEQVPPQPQLEQNGSKG
jgi:hypothetical protein